MRRNWRGEKVRDAMSCRKFALLVCCEFRLNILVPPNGLFIHLLTSLVRSEESAPSELIVDSRIDKPSNPSTPKITYLPKSKSKSQKKKLPHEKSKLLHTFLGYSLSFLDRERESEREKGLDTELRSRLSEKKSFDSYLCGGRMG